MAVAEVLPYIVAGGLVIGALARFLPAYLDRIGPGGPHLYRRIAAQVVDVSLLSRADLDFDQRLRVARMPQDFHRVLLRFKSETGALVVVDGVYHELDRDTLNALTPGHWVMIEYLRKNPEDFILDYAMGRQAQTDPPPSAAVELPPVLHWRGCVTALYKL